MGSGCREIPGTWESSGKKTIPQVSENESKALQGSLGYTDGHGSLWPNHCVSLYQPEPRSVQRKRTMAPGFSGQGSGKVPHTLSPPGDLSQAGISETTAPEAKLNVTNAGGKAKRPL